jgi:hypothetical protein
VVRLVGATSFVDVCLEVVSEQLEVAADGPRRRVPERTEAASVHPVAHVQEKVEILLTTFTVLDALEHFHLPPRALTARGALPARLVLVELRRNESVLDHAGRVIHEDDCPRPEHRALGLEGFEIHCNVRGRE